MARSLVHYAYPLDWTVLIGSVGVGYSVGLRRARKTASSPSGYQVAAFYASLAILLLSFATPIDAYDGVSLFDHMIQHLVFVFVVAPLFALGAPIGVLLEAAPPRVRDLVLLPILRGRAASALTRPAVAVLAFLVVEGATLFTPFFNAAISSGDLHLLQHGLLLVIGFVLWHSLVGVDSPTQRVDPRARLALTVLLVGFFASVGIAFLVTKVPLYRAYAALPPPWGGRGALESQRETGGLFIFGGGLLVLAAAAAVWAPAVRTAGAAHSPGAENRGRKRRARDRPGEGWTATHTDTPPP